MQSMSYGISGREWKLMRKINLLHVVCNNEFNGTERYVVDLAKNLNKDEFNVIVATPLEGPLSEVLKENNIREEIYNNGKKYYYSFKGLYNLYRIMKDNKIDIVHANAKFQPCIAAIFAGVKLKVETKHGIFYSKKQLENLSILRRMYEFAKQYFVDDFIATSENDRETLIKYFKISRKKVSVLFLGIDFYDMEKRSDGLFSYKPYNPGTEFIIGHIGRLTYQKAQEYLLEAFKIIAGKYEKARLVIVGSGENESILKKYIEENSLGDKISFKGYIKDIYREMQSYHAHVLTSRYEGTGYVNLEAMALGVPVITSNVGGATNFFTSGVDSIITEVENPASTAQAIGKLISDEKHRELLIINAFNTVKKYSVQKMTDDTSAYYKYKLKPHSK